MECHSIRQDQLPALVDLTIWRCEIHDVLFFDVLFFSTSLIFPCTPCSLEYLKIKIISNNCDRVDNSPMVLQTRYMNPESVNSAMLIPVKSAVYFGTASYGTS
jgi:hypothetical protein